MKKKKNNTLASQFPKIYRIITERKTVVKTYKLAIRLLNQPKLKKYMPWITKVFSLFAIIILSFGIIIFTLKIYENIATYTKIVFERQNLRSQISFWKSISEKYEGYKDAYFRIALLEYRLGNFDKAKEYNQKALFLDPNFEDAKKLEEILSN